MRQRSLLWHALAVAVGLAAPSAAAGDDGRAALQAACWPPSLLAGTSGENIPVRRQRPLATPTPPTVPTPPAAIAGVVRRVALPAGRKLIALTFDLCETAGEVAGYDGAIIDYLRSSGIKATFFAGGQWLMSHKVRGEQLLSDPLFEIGTHGWAHRNTRRIHGDELRREILAPSLAFGALRSELRRAQCAFGHALAFSAIPERPTLFRFPFGACNAAGLEAVADAGLLAIQWDVATADPSPTRSARAIAEAMIRSARPGSIIIAHANGRGYHTAQALPIAIPALRAKGFAFVTVSELMAAGTPVIEGTCYDQHPGDTDRYDFLFGRRPAASPPWELTSPHVRAAPSLPQ